MSRRSAPQWLALALLEVLTAHDAADVVAAALRAKPRRHGLGNSIRLIMTRLDALRSELAVHAERADSEASPGERHARTVMITVDEMALAAALALAYERGYAAAVATEKP